MVELAELQALLPPELLDELAVRFAVNKANQVRRPGQAVFLCLLNSLLNHPLVTQQLLADLYEESTGQAVHRSSFSYALARLPPRYLAALFLHLYRKLHGQLAPAEARAWRVRIIDATTVTLSAKLLHFGLHYGSQGRGAVHYDTRPVKSVFALGEAGLPEFLRLCREPAERNDHVALGDALLTVAQPGELWLFDRGCFDRDRFLSLHRQQAAFLTPLSTQKLRTLRPLWEAVAGAPGGTGLTQPEARGGGHEPAAAGRICGFRE